MNNIDFENNKDIFARLFVTAIQNKINLSSFVYMLERSRFVSVIESNKYDDYLNKTIEDIFYDVTNNRIAKDNSYGIYNDAYWCGASYFELFQRTRKPLAYIFLKLPLTKLIDIYSIYHEMDVSSLVQFFNKIEKEKTILRLLCEQKKCSLTKLSAATGINAATLSKYNASDDCLYNGSFQNITKIARYFDAPINLFLKEI